MVIKQGDIYEVKWLQKRRSTTDDGKVVYKDEQTIRPVLIISNDIMNKYSSTIIIVGITSHLDKVQLPSHVPIKGEEHNLPKDSTIVCEQVKTILKTDLFKRVSRVSDSTLKEVAKAFSFNTFVDATFFKKMDLKEVDFIIDESIPVKEDYNNEFKEIIAGKPYAEIRKEVKDVCVEYVAAFLNHGGGRILFGIEDKTSIVRGVALNPEERDDLSQTINNALHDSIKPSISALNYLMNFHDVLIDNGDPEHYDVLEDQYVLEILILPPTDSSAVYYTNKNRVFVRGHEQNRELQFNALTEFIVSKHQPK